MAFSDLFMSGAQKKNIGHYACIVKIAQADDVISDSEQHFLDRMAVQLQISERIKNKVFKDPDKFPINPPVGFKNRTECLYNLAKIIAMSSDEISREIALLVKAAIGLGFPLYSVDEIAEKAVKIVKKGGDFDSFFKEIKKIG